MYKVVFIRVCCIYFMLREIDLSNFEFIEIIEDVNFWFEVRYLLIMLDFWIEYMGILL